MRQDDFAEELRKIWHSIDQVPPTTIWVSLHTRDTVRWVGSLPRWKLWLYRIPWFWRRARTRYLREHPAPTNTMGGLDVFLGKEKEGS
jgi:hypothetical protein